MQVGRSRAGFPTDLQVLRRPSSLDPDAVYSGPRLKDVKETCRAGG